MHFNTSTIIILLLYALCCPSLITYSKFLLPSSTLRYLALYSSITTMHLPTILSAIYVKYRVDSTLA